MANHISVKLPEPCEFVNITPLNNPFISKCTIKVCYVGDQPNRNGSVITKAVAMDMAQSLPGSPIVGYYNEAKEDFEGHNRVIDISDGEFRIKETTKPYGFVDLNARVWFQKFLDDGEVVREYLMTEGYLWTDAYPEAKRILTEGNNQSMELTNVEGEWTKDDNGELEFFIINEALIQKLCILGEDIEPCFEGANITFSFDDGFKNQLFAMMNELKQFLKGGEMSTMEEIKDQSELFEADKKEDKPEKEEEEEICPDCGKPLSECTCDKDEPEDEDKKRYSELKEQYDALNTTLEDTKSTLAQVQNDYDTLKADYESLKAEAETLRAFKLQSETKAKQEMIDSFCMLSDEDKADVITNMNEYSLDEIEAKLAVICVRKRVSFAKEDRADEEEPVTTFNLNTVELADNRPAWIKAIDDSLKD